MSVYAGPDTVDSGLIFSLDAANSKSYSGSGTAWNDLISAANNSTLTNGPTFSYSADGYISFDGSNDYVSVPSTNNLLTFGTNAFSINFWIYLNTIGTNHTILTSYNSYNSGFSSYLFLGYWTATNRIGLLNSAGTSWPAYTTMATNAWTNICATKTGTTFNIYKNGTLIQTGTDASNNYSGSGRTVLIGGGLADFAHLNGRIAQLQIYNKELTAAEVLQNYAASSARFATPSEVKSGLTLNLDAGQSSSYPGFGTTWTNLGTVGGSYTLTNGPTYNSANGGSIVFDGTDDNVTGTAPTYYTDYTISCLFKISTFSSAAGLVSWGADSASQRRGLLYWNGGSGVNYRLISSTYGSNIFGTTTLATGTWYYGTVSVSSSGAARVYLNGALEGTGTNTLVSPASNTLKIGATNSAGEFLNGNIAIVKVFNRVLTDLEVASDFDALRSRFGI